MKHLIRTFFVVLLFCSAMNLFASGIDRLNNGVVFPTDTVCCDSIDSVFIQPYDSLIISCDSQAVTLTVPYDTCYNYVWYRNGQPISQIGLENVLTTTVGGTYYVVVSNNCFSMTSNIVTVVINAPIYYTASITNVSCYGMCNGVVTITPHGGTSPYTISWFGGSTSFTRTGLCAGTYPFEITDSLGCTDSGWVVITQPSALVVGGYCTCGSTTCTMTAQPSGGTPPYTYLWGNGQTTQSVTVSKLLKSVTVTVTDAHGCTGTKKFTSAECTSKSAGIEDQDGQSVQIYPNPVTEYISVDFENIPTQDVTIKILDMTGRIVYEASGLTPDRNVYYVNAAELPSGIYFVRVETGSELWVDKIIKE